MTWNYRIVHRHFECPDHGEDCSLCSEEWAIHEVYYNAAGEPYAVTVNPMAPLGETLEEFKDDFEHYAAAFTKPVLEYDDIPWAQEDAEEFLDESKRVNFDDIDWESF